MDVDVRNGDIRQISREELQNCFTFWDFEDNLKKTKRIESEIANGTRRMYAFVLDEKYVAGMSLSQLDSKTVYLSYLVVNEAYRRQGIGTRMIQYALQLSRSAGYSCVVLNVDKDCAAAQRLYRRLGFAVSGQNGERTEMKRVL